MIGIGFSENGVYIWVKRTGDETREKNVYEHFSPKTRLPGSYISVNWWNAPIYVVAQGSKTGLRMQMIVINEMDIEMAYTWLILSSWCRNYFWKAKIFKSMGRKCGYGKTENQCTLKNKWSAWCQINLFLGPLCRRKIVSPSCIPPLPGRQLCTFVQSSIMRLGEIGRFFT